MSFMNSTGLDELARRLGVWLSDPLVQPRAEARAHQSLAWIGHQHVPQRLAQALRILRINEVPAGIGNIERPADEEGAGHPGWLGCGCGIGRQIFTQAIQPRKIFRRHRMIDRAIIAQMEIAGRLNEQM